MIWCVSYDNFRFFDDEQSAEDTAARMAGRRKWKDMRVMRCNKESSPGAAGLNMQMQLADL